MCREVLVDENWEAWPRTREAVEASERAIEQDERWSILAALAAESGGRMVEIADGVFLERREPWVRPDPGE